MHNVCRTVYCNRHIIRKMFTFAANNIKNGKRSMLFHLCSSLIFRSACRPLLILFPLRRKCAKLCMQNLSYVKFLAKCHCTVCSVHTRKKFALDDVFSCSWRAAVDLQMAWLPHRSTQICSGKSKFQVVSRDCAPSCFGLCGSMNGECETCVRSENGLEMVFIVFDNDGEPKIVRSICLLSMLGNGAF